MKPRIFKESNVELQKPLGWTDDECGSLPAWTDGRICISCWQPTFKERLSILFFGRVWIQVYSGKTQPPVALDGVKTLFTHRGTNNGE